MKQAEQDQQEERNREIVRRAFEAWAQGTGMSSIC